MVTGRVRPKEASVVEFVIECAVDGPVEVSLEDVDTVVVREPEQADIVFTCPTCGAEVEVTIRIPSFLLSAIESLAEETGGQTLPIAGMVALSIDIEEADSTTTGAAGSSEETGCGCEGGCPGEVDDCCDDGRADETPERADAYCEYFRRQLEACSCVDDALAQIDSEV